MEDGWLRWPMQLLSQYIGFFGFKECPSYGALWHSLEMSDKGEEDTSIIVLVPVYQKCMLVRQQGRSGGRPRN
jgi:hypothetical protein